MKTYTETEAAELAITMSTRNGGWKLKVFEELTNPETKWDGILAFFSDDELKEFGANINAAQWKPNGRQQMKSFFNKKFKNSGIEISISRTDKNNKHGLFFKIEKGFEEWKQLFYPDKIVLPNTKAKNTKAKNTKIENGV